eukprot:5665804-Karenia_brevis.AAC.1
MDAQAELGIYRQSRCLFSGEEGRESEDFAARRPTRTLFVAREGAVRESTHLAGSADMSSSSS